MAPSCKMGPFAPTAQPTFPTSTKTTTPSASPTFTVTPSITATPEYACNADSSTLVLYHFEEHDERLVDASEKALHGYSKGAFPSDTGYQGNGFMCSENASYGLIPFSPTFNQLSQFTVESWIMRTGRTKSWNALVSRYAWDENNGNRSFELMISERDTLTFHVSPNGLENTEISLESKSLILLGQWTHVAGTWDGQNIHIFINGKEEGSIAFTGPLYATEKEMTLCAVNLGKGQFFEGLLDDVRISSIARDKSSLCAQIQ